MQHPYIARVVYCTVTTWFSSARSIVRSVPHPHTSAGIIRVQRPATRPLLVCRPPLAITRVAAAWTDTSYPVRCEACVVVVVVVGSGSTTNTPSTMLYSWKSFP